MNRAGAGAGRMSKRLLASYILDWVVIMYELSRDCGRHLADQLPQTHRNCWRTFHQNLAQPPPLFTH